MSDDERIVSARAITKKLVLIAIDRHSAAGQSTLAKQLAATLDGTTIFHTDDFYRVKDAQERFRLSAAEGYESYYDWQRLGQEVLSPLTAGKAISFHTYDWQNNSLGETR